MGRECKNSLLIITERSKMDIIEKMIKELSQKDTNTIYLREIAILMEEIDMLKDKLRVKEKLIKTLELGLQGKNDE